MDEVVYQHLLNDSAFFAPTEGHRIVEVGQPAVPSTEPQVRESTVSERRLATYWREAVENSVDAPLLRLLICSPRVLDRNIWPLPVSSGTLRDVLLTLGVPSLFPRAMCHHLPLATSFDTLQDDGRFGVLLRTNLIWTWQYALALVYDPARKTTNAVLFGLRSNEIDDLVQSIRRSAHLFVSPAMLPCILMDKALDVLVRDAEDRRTSLIQICYDTGLHGFSRLSILPDQQQTTDERDELDLDILMQKLTSLSDACAGITAVCKMQTEFINTLNAFQTRCDPGFTQLASRHAQQQLRFFGPFLHGIGSKTLYTSSSVQGQIQTIYALINQRESRNHFVLAESSRQLAAWTRKDSTDMRIIAAVTLIFLPATFTSTFFSASFFDFQPGDNAKVSSWIWLYWVITAALTVAVLGAWWYWAAVQHREAQTATRRQSRKQEEATKRRQSVFGLGLGMGQQDVQQEARVAAAFRPYLSGSVAEGVFARKLTIPFDGPGRVDTSEVSPTTTRRNTVRWPKIPSSHAEEP